MKVEVLNTIKRKGDKWEFSGKFSFNGQWIPITGVVPDAKTESQIKKLIIRKINAKAKTYKEEASIPKEKILTIDNIFKDIL